MKTRTISSIPSHLRTLIFLAITACAPALFAASGQWITDAGGTQNWGTATNWSGGTIADGADNTATFDKGISASRTVTLNTSRTIGNLVCSNTFVTGASNYTIGVSS